MLYVTHITSRDNCITVRLQRATHCSASSYKNTSRKPLLKCYMLFSLSSLSVSTLSSTSLYPWPPPTSSGGFLLHRLGTWREGRGWGSLSIFLRHHVQQETANWSVKQGCSLQVATAWAHLPLNSLWQVRSQPRGGARRPTVRREACGCSSSAS